MSENALPPKKKRLIKELLFIEEFFNKRRKSSKGAPEGLAEGFPELYGTPTDHLLTKLSFVVYQ